MPRFRQIMVESKSGQTGKDLERSLFIVRKLVEKERDATFDADTAFDFATCTLSNQTIVYKGMLNSASVGPFFKDLTNPAYVTNFAIYHRRFSTNTNPRWPLAQPFRVLGHNGEINTLQGNINWVTKNQRYGRSGRSGRSGGLGLGHDHGDQTQDGVLELVDEPEHVPGQRPGAGHRRADRVEDAEQRPHASGIADAAVHHVPARERRDFQLVVERVRAALRGALDNLALVNERTRERRSERRSERTSERANERTSERASVGA